jgi:hypothetical protein
MIHRHHRWYLLIAVGLAAVVLLISRRHSTPPLTETAPPPPVPVAAPPPAPRSPAFSPPRAPPPPTPGAPVGDQAAIMARIRDAVHSRPDKALALLDALDQAHPGATDGAAEERAALRVDALVSAQRIGLARDAAEEFLRRYPHSSRAEHIEVLTGVHPHPSDPNE